MVGSPLQRGIVRFGPFRLDTQRRLLFHADSSVGLRPKTLEVLLELLRQRGQVVSKDDLLTKVWQGRAVSEYVLTTCISELRTALKDDSRQPCFLKTVHRTGYQLLLDTPVEASDVDAVPSPPSIAPTIVGRHHELGRLNSALQRAATGERQIALITGEMGIGKTTLADELLRYAAGVGSPPRIARGQCIETFGPGEPFMPVFEAIGRLGRESDGSMMIDQLRQHAPTWLIQIPGLLPAEERSELRRGLPPETREHLLRSIADGIEAICRTRLLVLLLEDLHLSDPATLELIAALALRRGPARLLLLGTFRDAESFERTGPFQSLKQQLLLHRQCEEIALRPLGRQDVDTYLVRRFPGLTLPPDLSGLIHDRTEGNPLFIARLLDQLIEEGLIEIDPQAARVALKSVDVASHVPPTLRAMIEQRTESMGESDLELLEVASVAGVQFWSSTIAPALGHEREAIELRCSRICRRHGVLALLEDGDATLPSLGGRFRFCHSLYQQVLYERIETTRRQRLHRAIGAALHEGWGTRAVEIAAEIAWHFERGSDFGRAIEFYDRAAVTTTEKGANREAIGYLDRALALLERETDEATRRNRQLDLLMTRGPSILAVFGHGSQEVLDNYRRALDLARDLGQPMREMSCLGALAVCEQTRANLEQGEALALSMIAVAERIGLPPPILAQLRNPLSQVRLYQGMVDEALALSEEAVAGLGSFGLPAPPPGDRPAMWADIGVMLHCQQAAVRFARGHLSRAGDAVARALQIARDLQHPFNLAYAATWGALYEDSLGRWDRAMALAQETIEVAQTYDFPFWGGIGRIFGGHALGRSGELLRGCAMIREGIALWQGTGGRIAFSMYCNLLADLCLRIDDMDSAWQALELASTHAEQTGEVVFTPETLRLRAQCRQQSRAPLRESENELRRALAIAAAQRTRLWQLRASIALHRLLASEDSRARLSEALDYLERERELPDLEEARALLES